MSSDPGATPANDDAPAPADAISFTDLCAAMGEDEDTVLQRLARVLSKRAAHVKEVPDGES